MQEPPIPVDEEKRLALLKACNIIYTPAEEAFDDVARLAAELCGTEIALITLVDSDYQWFKARVGVEQTGTPRDLSFCGHCINHTHPLVVEDTHLDARFADNPLVTGDPMIRFYAGVPLIVEEGSSIGALSVADRTPGTLSPQKLASLERLAKQISRELRLRRDIEQARAARKAADFPVGPGSTVGAWTLTREIGRGGGGVVFEARDAHGERAAIKVLLPTWRANAEIVERFVREARVLMHLKTPHVAKLLDVGNLTVEEGGLPYLALEYLEGTDLHQVMEEKGRVPFRDAFSWGADACDGLAEAHELGVVHRDLKPSNVFLAANASARAPVVKVLDFGIATGDAAMSGAKITNMGAVIGTPRYMSPEQMMASSDVDPRSDIWSMGAMLYELITGESPFKSTSDLALFANVMTKPPVPVSEHLGAEAAAVEPVLFKCLSKTREDRYPTMSALASALRSAIA